MLRLSALIAVAALLTVGARAQAQTPAAAGAQIYLDQCSECHGPGLRNPGTSFDLKKLKAGERARFEKSVLDGKGQMPPWRGTLNEEQLGQLWAYIREYAYE